MYYSELCIFLHYHSWWNITCTLNSFVIAGYVEWKEYYKHFLLAKGHGLNETEKYLEDYDTDILQDDGKMKVWIWITCRSLTHPLQNESTYNILYLFFVERDKLVWYKFKWTDADIKPIDNRLDVEEFFSFRHPEHSVQLIENMVLSIINSLGKISGKW